MWILVFIQSINLICKILPELLTNTQKFVKFTDCWTLLNYLWPFNNH